MNDVAVSSDGRYVAFVTGDQVDVADTNTSVDIYRLDRDTGDIALVSPAINNGQIADCIQPAISGDGNIIAFVSRLDLVAEDNNGTQDVYVRDMTAAPGEYELVSARPNGTAPTNGGSSLIPSISDDGNNVAFFSTGSGMVASPTLTTLNHCYVRARDGLGGGTTAVVTIAETNSGIVEGNCDPNVDMLAISGDGNRVAFISGSIPLAEASNPPATNANGAQMVFVRDLLAPSTIAISTGLANASPDESSFFVDLDFDGDRVSFISRATNLVDPANGAYENAFVFSLDGTSRVRIPDVGRADNPATRTRLSNDGTRLFVAASQNLDASLDNNNQRDIYLVDLDPLGSPQLVNRRFGDGRSPFNFSSPPDTQKLDISDDGTFVVFVSTSGEYLDPPLTDLSFDGRAYSAQVP